MKYFCCMVLFVFIFITAHAQLYYEDKEFIYDLPQMKIKNKVLFDSIMKYDADIRRVHNYTEKYDTLAILCNSDDFKVNVMLLRNSEFYLKTSALAIDYGIIGVCKKGNTLYVLCGAYEEYAAYKKKKRLKEIRLLEGITGFDGFPPIWTFLVDGKKVKLIERYIPKHWVMEGKDSIGVQNRIGGD